MPRLIDVFSRLRDRLWGPTLRTYDRAREELGGVAWRPFQNTERWFMPPVPTESSRQASLDSSALVIARPSILERLRGSGGAGWLVGAGVLAAVLVVALASHRSSAAPSVAAPVAAAPKAAPAPAPAPAPVHAASPMLAHLSTPSIDHPRMSASVRALLNGGGKSSHTARPAHKKAHRR